MSNFEIFKSQRNKDVLFWKGFVYNEDGMLLDGAQRFRCRDRKCKGKVSFFKANRTLIEVSSHNHSNESTKSQVEISRKKIKTRAIETSERPKDIVAKEIITLNNRERCEAPKLKSMLDSVTRLRSKEFSHGILSQAGEDIPDSLKFTSKGHEFLMYDSGFDSYERFLIYCSQEQLIYLRKSKTWLIDGTFRCAPRDFNQMISIRGMISGKAYALAFIIINSKRERLYQKAFEILREKLNCSPQNIITDFEKGLIGATKMVFPEAHNYGCQFHHSQATWRKVQELGLASDFHNNEQIRIVYKKLMSLSFFPETEVLAVFNHLKTSFLLEATNEGVKTFINYFEKNYIMGTESSHYNINFWSCYHRVVNNIPRTINSSEAWHRSVNFQTVVKHPNLAKLVEVLQTEEDLTSFSLTRVCSGVEVPTPNIDYKKEWKLREVLRDHQIYDLESYFDTLFLIHTWKVE